MKRSRLLAGGLLVLLGARHIAHGAAARKKLHELTVGFGAEAIKRLEAAIAWGSRVGNPEFFPNELFPWRRVLEDGWCDIRAELDELLRDPDAIPPFQELSPDQRSISDDDRWKTFFLFAFGYKAERNCARCPKTTELVMKVPGMTTAFFSILAPGKHLPPHRGAFKGLVRYHLGLLVPDPHLCGIRVGCETRSWQEGHSLIFDDTFEHEAWNDSDSLRVVLFLDFKRPLRFPANLLNILVVETIKRSPFVTDAIENYNAWQEKLDAVGSP